MFKFEETSKSFEIITELLHQFGNPQDRLPPVIHVAGTNGKGSTCAFLYAALRAGGFRVHRLTSPHLCEQSERIVVANEPIAGHIMADYLQQAYALTGGMISFPEAVTATAFRVFAENPADIALIEVGLGGRWDGTNTLSNTCVSVITPISMDHQKRLGPTYRHIAFQKSGIMRAGIPCVSAIQRRDVAQEIKAQAALLGSPLFLAQENWFFKEKGNGVQVWYPVDGPADFFPEIGLMGEHQRANAALAAMTLYVQDALSVPFSAMVKGFAQALWPGRLQSVDSHSLGFAPHHEVWIDGAHNEGGFEVLAAHIQKEGWQADSEKPLIVVLGMLPKKNPMPFWAHLAPLADQVWVLSSFGEHTGVPLEHMQGCVGHDIYGASPCLKAARGFSNFDQAIEASFSLKSMRFLICGSIYLMGEILKKAQR